MNFDYDVIMPLLCPPYARAQELFSERCRGDTIYELGAGTGNIASTLLKDHPERLYVGVDNDPSMLAIARKKLPVDQATLIEGDFSRVALPSVDTIVSSLSIHHLEHAEQRSLFERIYAASPVFLHFELIAPENEREKERDERYLLDHAFAQEKALGLSRDEIIQLKEVSERKDRPMMLKDHISALESIGYSVDILLRDHCFVFYHCERPRNL